MLYEIRVKIDEGGYMPVRGHEDDAGLDLRTPVYWDQYSTEQAAKGRKAEIEAEIEEMKLHALRYGIRRVKL